MRTYVPQVCFALLALLPQVATFAIEPVRVADDGRSFVTGPDAKPFVVWGVNYDHDQEGRLLDEYWREEWPRVREDFEEIRALGANTVRIHLQFGLFMDSPSQPNSEALGQLRKLVELSEELGLYLDITGLACYHKRNVPVWYDKLDEVARWEAQAVFWEAVAETCKASPAVFCYDLMNEPILPGREPSDEWLGGELSGKFFVQRISLDAAGRTRQAIAKAWVETLTAAIRKHDTEHMITVGVIPWVFVFGGGEPLFHSPEVGAKLDFVSVHFYPEQGEVRKALTALKAYEVGKPLVIEEMFPLKCSADEMKKFIQESKSIADGWISFYWGATADELEQQENATIGDHITAKWLREFAELAPPR